MDYKGYNPTNDEETTNTNPWRYAGEYFDFETQNYYLRARYYNPATGRFTQPDPFWNTNNMQDCVWSILQAGNLYSYTMNNPVMFVDPSGLSVTIWWDDADGARTNGSQSQSFLGIDLSSPSDIFLIFHSATELSGQGVAAFAQHANITGARPSNIGVGAHAKQVAQETLRITNFTTSFSRVMNVLAYAGVLIDVGVSIHGNISDDAPVEITILEAVGAGGRGVAMVVTAGATSTMVKSAFKGAAFGSVVPIFGTLLGFAAGFTVGQFIDAINNGATPMSSDMEHLWRRMMLGPVTPLTMDLRQ